MTAFNGHEETGGTGQDDDVRMVNDEQVQDVEQAKLVQLCSKLQTALVRRPAGMGDGSDVDWVMIELQGDLRVEDSTISDPSESERHFGMTDNMSGMNLGNLEYVNGVPILEVGYHRLEGKLVKMKKPLAVLRPDMPDAMSSDENANVDAETLGQHSKHQQGQEKSFAILGVIRDKLVFKTRPKPLQISRQSQNNKRIKA